MKVLLAERIGPGGIESHLTSPQAVSCIALNRGNYLLTPIPRGESLEAIAQTVQVEIERAFAAKIDAAGVPATERWVEEAPHCLPLPAVPFRARQVVLVGVSRGSLVRVERARYSVPSRWAGLEATAYVGVETIRLVCRGEELELAKQRRGSRAIRYRHYLRFSAVVKRAAAPLCTGLRFLAEESLSEGGEWAFGREHTMPRRAQR